MSRPTPLRSFIGGIGLAFPIHSLAVLNGNVFGISGFIHRAVRGNREAALGTLGLVAGGLFAGLVETQTEGRELAQSMALLPSPLLLFSGLLVGLGTKMANGCTSGHMLAGISRLSTRSITSTAIFFTFGVLTTRLVHGSSLPASLPTFWGIDQTSQILLLAQTVPLVMSALLYFRFSSSATGTPPSEASQNPNSNESSSHQISEPSETTALTTSSNNPTLNSNSPHRKARLLTYFLTSFEFALALRLSDLSNPLKVLSFLILPFPPIHAQQAFDPSLAFLAASALPLSLVFYQFGVKPKYYSNSKKEEDGKHGSRVLEHPTTITTTSPHPVLGGTWSIPRPMDQGKVDTRLVLGSAVFGVGWGLAGVCPGPVLVNLGRSTIHFFQHSSGDLSKLRYGTGQGLAESFVWLVAFVLGGWLV
ncbi:hypothetical protein K435DRAFT_843257 [Dendrothele bispora CBS 962.96]|uniref:Uncharacterized protein n=1 Tax=Dendrothele bispora (strain CBS 962.96) TaxID=1314807 RepID=A0A4S8L9R7_DENBC|nr:hypothetical protein K435DRAFT_843257 [Dendrothele bispora CBS 962.96]